MHAGDMFAWKALPFIDVSNGGSAVGHPQTLAKAMSTIKNVDTVITGHTPLMKWNDLQEYADFSKDFVAWAQAEMKAGKTVDQAAAEYKVPASIQGLHRRRRLVRRSQRKHAGCLRRAQEVARTRM